MDNNCQKHEYMNKSSEYELAALIKYMINHNASHTNELSELAEKLSKEDQGEAYNFVKEAISDFEAANEKLSLALEAMIRR